MESRNPTGQVAVLHKALDLLECLAAAPLTAADISDRIGVAKPTVYRLLSTLQSRGFVAKEPDGSRYMLGDAARALGAASASPADLISLTRPFTTKLAATWQPTPTKKPPDCPPMKRPHRQTNPAATKRRAPTSPCQPSNLHRARMQKSPSS